MVLHRSTGKGRQEVMGESHSTALLSRCSCKPLANKNKPAVSLPSPGAGWPPRKPSPWPSSCDTRWEFASHQETPAFVLSR